MEVRVAAARAEEGNGARSTRFSDDGVASPHMRRTLRHIQELKRKHGIDHDCHACYRLVEK